MARTFVRDGYTFFSARFTYRVDPLRYVTTLQCIRYPRANAQLDIKTRDRLIALDHFGRPVLDVILSDYRWTYRQGHRR